MRLPALALCAALLGVFATGCGGGGGGSIAPQPIGATPAAGQGSATPVPGVTATASPGAAASAGASPAATATAIAVATASPAPAASAASIDRTCDAAVYPSAMWTQCEATNYAMTTQAPTEQAMSTAYLTRFQTQSSANTNDFTARDTADPSWLSPLSGDTPQTPLCATWGSMCVGDPFRYAAATGADGSSFYSGEAVVTPFVFYDDGCARLSGRVWAPAGSHAGSSLPNIVIDNGSVEAPETYYWWAAETLVRNGYVVMTFDPRGQGRSDMQTPTGGQGGNVNTAVFWTGLVNAIDFFRSTPDRVYPWNSVCAGTYPTVVTNYNPYYDRIDRSRLGIAGHSEGAIGVSIVQGYGGPGADPWPGQIDATNPVKAAVMWDGLRAPAGGDVGGIGSSGAEGATIPNYTARVPSLGMSSEYGLTPEPFTQPPNDELHKAGYAAWYAAGTPVDEITIRGSTHYEWSLLTNLPATSWCPNAASGACENGWGNALAQYQTLAWFDRWLKLPGETGYADADSRLLNDSGVQGINKYSFRFHSARAFPDRSGTQHHCEDVRAGCNPI